MSNIFELGVEAGVGGVAENNGVEGGSSFDAGVEAALAKVAASSNPAAPQKSSRDGMERSSPSAAYLNMGGGRAQQHSAGGVMDRPQPWPGYVNHSKGAPEQTAGNVGGRGGAPDTGEMGSAYGGGDHSAMSKSAFLAGMDAVMDEIID